MGNKQAAGFADIFELPFIQKPRGINSTSYFFISELY